MSVGGTIIDIVQVSSNKWWINTFDKHDLCAVYCDPQGLPLEVGDSLWWQAGKCYWTPRSRARRDVAIPKIGYSGVPHPDKLIQGQQP